MVNNEKSFNENGRVSFNVFIDWRESLDELTMEERGMFLTMLYDAYSYKTPQPVPEGKIALKMFWKSVKSLIKRNLKYDIDKKKTIKSTDYLDTVLEQSTDSIVTVPLQSSTTYTNTSTETSTGTITVTNTGTNTHTSKRTETIGEKNIKDYYSKLDDKSKDALVNSTKGMSKSEVDSYINELILNQ
jgi:hypothetical protein